MIDNSQQISRALVVQNHTLSSTFVDRLFEVFAHGEVGWDAAKAIGKLVEPDDVLLKKHHAVVKVGVWILCPRVGCTESDLSDPTCPEICEPDITPDHHWSER